MTWDFRKSKSNWIFIFGSRTQIQHTKNQILVIIIFKSVSNIKNLILTEKPFGNTFHTDMSLNFGNKFDHKYVIWSANCSLYQLFFDKKILKKYRKREKADVYHIYGANTNELHHNRKRPSGGLLLWWIYCPNALQLKNYISSQ